MRRVLRGQLAIGIRSWIILNPVTKEIPIIRVQSQAIARTATKNSLGSDKVSLDPIGQNLCVLPRYISEYGEKDRCGRQPLLAIDENEFVVILNSDDRTDEVVLSCDVRTWMALFERRQVKPEGVDFILVPGVASLIVRDDESALGV